MMAYCTHFMVLIALDLTANGHSNDINDLVGWSFGEMIIITSKCNHASVFKVMVIAFAWSFKKKKSSNTTTILPCHRICDGSFQPSK